MCAVLWWCSWTDGDQVQPLSPRHLSPLACIQPPRASPPLPSTSFLLSLEGRQRCVCLCVSVWRRGLPWLSGGGSSSPFCTPPPPPSQVTVGGPSWPALGRLDPYGTGRQGGGGGGGEVPISCMAAKGAVRVSLICPELKGWQFFFIILFT